MTRSTYIPFDDGSIADFIRARDHLIAVENKCIDKYPMGLPPVDSPPNPDRIELEAAQAAFDRANERRKALRNG
jgi:hypothetical protein